MNLFTDHTGCVMLLMLKVCELVTEARTTSIFVVRTHSWMETIWFFCYTFLNSSVCVVLLRIGGC